MGKLIGDISRSADDIARELRKFNYRANFSPQSLWDIDLFFDDHSAEGAPKPKGLLAEKMGQRLFALGGYVGETIRRNLGGEWQADDANPRGEINIALKLPDGSLIWPVQRVMKRLKNGPEDGIAAYGSGLGLNVGERPAPFSQFRRQSTPAGTAATPSAVFPPEVYMELIQQRNQTNQWKNWCGGILLFLGSVLASAYLADVIASEWDHRMYLPARFFITLSAVFCGAGSKLCEAPKQVAGWIWICFCPVALLNSLYFQHMQNDPFIQLRASSLLYVTGMSKSSLVMAGATLVVGAILLWLHRNETVMCDEL